MRFFNELHSVTRQYQTRPEAGPSAPPHLAASLTSNGLPTRWHNSVPALPSLILFVVSLAHMLNLSSLKLLL
jgi:hypothetical protein